MIELEGVCKHYGRLLAVDDLSFAVTPGEVLGLLGPNGAGKSTTMRILTGFLRPDRGRVRIFDRDPGRSPRNLMTLLGYLPEGAPSYADMSVRAFLHFIAAARGIARGQRRSRVAAVMAQLQLDGVGGRLIDTLSKGYRRRVALAQALVHDPAVLLLDEPTDGLDPNQKHEVRQLIRHLSRDKIVILSTHNLDEVDALCSRAVILQRGRLVVDAGLMDLKARSEYQQAVELELSVAACAALRPALAGLPGVRAVRQLGDGRLLLLPQPGQSIWSAVTDLLRQQGVEPRALSVSAGRLDDVFRRVTAEIAVSGAR